MTTLTAYAAAIELGRRTPKIVTVTDGRPYDRALAMVDGPYWQHGNARMWRGDARALPLPDESVHLIVTSPPYNAKIRYRGYHDWLSWADYWDGLIVPSLREMYRVLVPGGRACINFANVLRYRTDMPAVRKPAGKPKPFERQAWGKLTDAVLWPELERLGFLLRERLTWVKSEAGETIAPSTAWGSWLSPSNPVLRAVAEPVYIVSKGSYDRYSSANSTLDHDDFMAWTRNIWYIPQEPHAVNPFPARFPRELARRLILLYSFRHDTVLDPFAGSGTTLIEAALNTRASVGIEASEHYVKMARTRYRKIMAAS